MTVPLLSALSLLLVPAYSLNNATNINNSAAPKKVGWYDVSYRGTTTVLYSCLCTIFACTYTSLHLNVPSPRDSKWTKLLRKAKWMALTILFPEFAFAKAVCELQMAAADWCGLRTASDRGFFNWTFTNSKLIPAIHKFFMFFLNIDTRAEKYAGHEHSRRSAHNSRPSSVSAFELEENLSSTCSLQMYRHKSQEWTLAHSYFTNMGGVVLLQENPGRYHYVTAQGLLQCCLPHDINALSDIHLSEMDIADKAKADVFVKLIAVCQASWLVVTIWARVGRQLPVSQLEVCTAAFAILTFATYLANWSKPKDVEVPLFIPYKESLNCRSFDHHGDCFIRRSLQPAYTTQKIQTGSISRIRNDELRPYGQDRHFPVLSCSLALSTLVFGAIHCAAWLADFPTRVERVTWLTASVASAVLPLLNLLFSFLVQRWLNRKILRYEREMRSDVDQRPPLHTTGRQQSLGEGKIAIIKPEGEISIKSFHQHDFWNQLHRVEEAIWLLRYQGHLDFTLSQSWTNLYREYKKLNSTGLWITYCHKRVEDPVPSPFPAYEFSHQDGTQCTQTVIDALNNPLNPIATWISKLFLLPYQTDRISTIFTLVSWSVYILARITILVLAFAALRSQDERLYIETWTRNLPKIG